MRKTRRKLKNCDMPKARWKWWTGTCSILKPASWTFFMSSTQMMPLLDSRCTTLNMPSDQAEIAIDVSELQAEGDADDVVV